MSNINRIHLSNSGLERAAAVHARNEARQAESGNPSSVNRDSIALSGRARALDRLTALVQQSHNERLEQVRQELEAGTYAVSSADIAKKMIESNWR